MADLQNITYDEINIKLLIILYANENKLFDQYTLFNMTVDKFRTSQNINYISPEFKSKFLLVLRSLMSKNKDIIVTKKNNVYYVGYEMINTDIDYTINYSEHWLDKKFLNEYIINYNLEDELTYVDPENGNTIFHDILSSNNNSFIEKVIKTFDIDYNSKNNNDKTPIECVNDLKITLFIINDLNCRLYSMDKRITKLESTNYVSETSIVTFLKLKFIIFINSNFNYLLTLVLLLFAIIVYKLI